MNFEILNRTFYDNQVQSWIIGLGIIILSISLAKIVHWCFKALALRHTEKEKLKIKTIIQNAIEAPVSFAIGLIGIQIGFQFLNFSEEFDSTKSKIFHFLLILNLIWLIERLTRSFFENFLIPLSERKETSFDNALVPILQRGSSFILWSLGFVIGLKKIGFDVGAVLAGLGIGGLAFAIAAKDSVSNMFGGITILLDKPFRKNDRIKVKGIEGRVTDISLRTTKIITLEGRKVTIPNSSFIDNSVENVTSEPSRKIIHSIKLAHTNNYTKLNEAIPLIQKIIDSNPKVDISKTIVSFLAIEETGFTIQMIYYINYSTAKEIHDTQTQINSELVSTLEQNWIKLAYNILSRA